MSGADRGRAGVYAAELAAFDGTSYESVVPLVELQQLASRVVATDWWPNGPVVVEAARVDARSSNTRIRGSSAPVIRLAAQQRTPATLVHELAHALAGPTQGHGPLFRRAYVDLAAHCFGAEQAGWLRVAFADAGLRLSARTWPTPPIRTTTIAL